MTALDVNDLPKTISIFPGLEDKVYFQHPDTKEYWFQASGVCKVMGYSNVSSALNLHCEEDEKLMEIWNRKATWFVSEAGIYGLAMGAKTEIALKFKRWLKHEVLPKLRETGLYADRSRFSNAEYDQLMLVVKQRDERIGKLTQELEAKYNFLNQFTKMEMDERNELENILDEWEDRDEALKPMLQCAKKRCGATRTNKAIG